MPVTASAPGPLAARDADHDGDHRAEHRGQRRDHRHRADGQPAVEEHDAEQADGARRDAPRHVAPLYADPGSSATASTASRRLNPLLTSTTVGRAARGEPPGRR